MPRQFGSRNRTKIPKASEIVKYASQSLVEGMLYLDEIITSKDPSVSIKNKMDAIKQVKELLDMAGYGKELEAGKDKIIEEEGELNKFREVKQNTPSTSPDDALPEEVKGETPLTDEILGRYTE